MHMETITHSPLLNLPLILFSVLSCNIHLPASARPLPNTDHFIAFFIDDVLRSTSRSSLPVTDNFSRLPFSRPAGLSDSRGGGVHTTTPPYGHVRGQAEASLGWLPFLSSVQSLEAGNVTVIEEELTGVTLTGKVQGIYVASTEDESSRMVAMRAVFGGGGSEDSLRFFGEHQPGLPESHIAVVGGTGRYHDANGFAVVKAAGQEVSGGRRRRKRRLLFNVYIKKSLG